MTGDLQAGISRLEKALALLHREDVGSWYDAYEIAARKMKEDDDEDWTAIRALVIVATHGAPQELSYLDEEFMALIDSDASR
jgi:hypothetical protein